MGHVRERPGARRDVTSPPPPRAASCCLPGSSSLTGAAGAPTGRPATRATPEHRALLGLAGGLFGGPAYVPTTPGVWRASSGSCLLGGCWSRSPNAKPGQG